MTTTTEQVAVVSAQVPVEVRERLLELARFMGTSVDQIDKTYGHLLPDSLDRTRSALDAFINNTALEAVVNKRR